MSLEVLVKMEQTKLQIMAERAINGDEEALEYLDLEEVSVIGSDPRPITWDVLCANYYYCAHVLIVATKLNLHILRRTAHMSLRQAAHIARHHYKREFPEITTTCTVEELANTLSMVLEDVPPAHLSRREDFDSDTSTEEDVPQCKKTKKNEEKNQKQEKQEKPRKKEEKEGRSHHVTVKCRIAGCDAKVQDIRRHLRMHVKNNELHPEDLDTYRNYMAWETENAGFTNHPKIER